MAVGNDGSIYVAAGTSGKFQKVTPDRKVSTVVSVTSLTAATFGRGEADKGTLYITSGNG